MKQAITIQIDPELLENARKCAEQENRTLTNFIETALKARLEASGSSLNSAPNVGDGTPLCSLLNRQQHQPLVRSGHCLILNDTFDQPGSLQRRAFRFPAAAASFIQWTSKSFPVRVLIAAHSTAANQLTVPFLPRL
jgi:hypothetical protein